MERFKSTLAIDSENVPAHYNLALVCERLEAFDEARMHWRRYIDLDPASPWCDFARERLGEKQTKPGALHPHHQSEND